MRPFAITVPTIWTGDTGVDWREHGKDYQLLGHYLIESPYSNMYGLYYQPFSALLEEVGVEHDSAMAVLQHFAHTRFALYDKRTNWVWVVNGWRFQLYAFGRVPPPTDKRIIGMHRWYQACPPNPFLGHFYDEYGAEFRMPQRRDEKTRPSAIRPQTLHAQRQGFELWTAEYPNKDGLGAAWSLWCAIDPAPTTEYVESTMLPRLREQKATTRWQEEDFRFVPSASRYLEERRWLDPVAAANGASTGSEVDEWLARRRENADGPDNDGGGTRGE